MTVIPYVLACLAVFLTPGPTNTILTPSGAVMGVRNAAILPLAEAIGYTLAVSAFVMMDAARLEGIAIFISLSVAAGGCWLMIGSALPRGYRHHSYKAAAVVVFGFSIAAAASAAHF